MPTPRRSPANRRTSRATVDERPPNRLVRSANWLGARPAEESSERGGVCAGWMSSAARAPSRRSHSSAGSVAEHASGPVITGRHDDRRGVGPVPAGVCSWEREKATWRGLTGRQSTRAGEESSATHVGGGGPARTCSARGILRRIPSAVRSGDGVPADDRIAAQPDAAPRPASCGPDAAIFFRPHAARVGSPSWPSLKQPNSAHRRRSDPDRYASHVEGTMRARSLAASGRR